MRLDAIRTESLVMSFESAGALPKAKLTLCSRRSRDAHFLQSTLRQRCAQSSRFHTSIQRQSLVKSGYFL